MLLHIRIGVVQEKNEKLENKNKLILDVRRGVFIKKIKNYE